MKKRIIPRPESIAFFEKTLHDHDKIRSYRKISSQVYLINRTNGTPIKVYITDIYTVGLVDYHSITEKYSDLNAIVTLSNWNGYTKQAKLHAKENLIGIFVVTEFLGAINFEQIYNYVRRDDE